MSAQLRTGSDKKNETVARDVRAITSRGPGLVLPALAALGIGGPASALELGPATVQSALGQPLRASIAFALRPFEEIAPHCVRVSPGRSASGLPSAGRASVSVDDGVIRVLGDSPVTDPLLGLQLTVDCPYAPHLSREYVVFVDPEHPAATDFFQPAASSVPARREPAVTRASAAAPTPAIAARAPYRVQRGDTLSGIAERLPGRRVGLWQAAELLFATNPGAFIDNDPDLLRAGVLLRIPDGLYTGAPPAAAERRVAESPAPTQTSPARSSGSRASPAHASTAQTSTVYPGYVPDATAAAEAPDTASVPHGLFRDGASEATVTVPPAATIPPQPVAPRAGRPGTLAEEPAAAPDASPRPGDVRVDADGLFVSPIEAEEDSGAAREATPFVEPAADSATPALPAALQREEAAIGNGSWLLWLGGSGVALILGLLLFGRTLKSRAADGRAPGESFARRRDADALDEEAELEGDEMKVDFRFDDAGSDARIVRVDADLDDGTGFQETGDVDVAQDFGFSASGGLELGLDVDFSEESPARPARPGTAARRREGDVIVEREIPPGDPATSEYDVSMIVDATRQPLDDVDDTEKDLHAIELENDGAEPEEDPFTLSREVDYRILEQDYEEELTATQALAAELSHAARDLVERLYDEPGETSLHELPTVKMPAPGSEPTVEMPSPAAEPTAERPRAASPDAGESRTVEMIPDSGKAEGGDIDANGELSILAEAENDASAEIEIESATIDTKKLKAS